MSVDALLLARLDLNPLHDAPVVFEQWAPLALAFGGSRFVALMADRPRYEVRVLSAPIHRRYLPSTGRPA